MRPVSKVVPDASQLKALTHPDRLKMLAILRHEGPETATSLGARLGLNSGAASYHLRQLALHGFIEIDESRGSRRDKWWKARHEVTTVDTAEASGDARDAGMAMIQSVISQHAAAMQGAHEAYSDLPMEWRRAQTFNDLTFAMPPEAARALIDEMMELLWKARDAAPKPGEALPDGWRPFTIHLHGFPYVPPGRGK